MVLQLRVVSTCRNQTKYNGPGHETRFDQPATFYEKAIPQHLAHAVFYIQDIEGTPAFYRDVGFKLTDAYVGRGVSALRQINRSSNLFCVSDAGQGVSSCAFEVRDFRSFGAACG